MLKSCFFKDDYYRLGAYLYKCRLESIVDGVDKINGTKIY